MEEQDKILQRLVKQRHLRPSYNRAISKELSKVSDEQQTSSKLHSHREAEPSSIQQVEHDPDQCDEDVFERSSESASLDESSDESVYNSCAEDVEQMSLLADDESKSKCACSEAKQNIPTRTDECETGVLGQSNNRRKRGSKRQRKKKCLQMKDFLRPFMLSEDFDIVDSLMEDRNIDITVNKSVPSLVSLCLSVCNRKKRHDSAESTGEKETVKRIGRFELGGHTIIESVQLSWLDKFLTYCESPNTGTRSDYGRLRTLNSIHPFQLGEKTEAYRVDNIPTTSWIPYNYLKYCGMFIYQVLSALASMIDLMLPQSLSERNLYHLIKEEPSEDDAIEKACQNAEARVYKLLTKKYPQVINTYFWDAVPYAWWARGNVHTAANRFLSLMKKECDHKLKSMYMNEMGRLYNHFGNVSRASWCFRQAADFFKIGGDKELFDADVQALTLIANSHDQGILTSHSAVSSWMAVLSFHEPPSCAFHAAYDSWLCFHAYNEENDSAWSAAEERLKLAVQEHSELYHHLSLCQAVQGHNEASSHSIRHYLMLKEENIQQSCKSKILGKGSRDTNIWKPIIEQVEVQKHSIKPIRMLWRTQLTHPVYSENRYCRVADHSSDDLRLWMTADGLLTGNMQMYLPCLRSVYIDPYTGSLHLPHVPCPSAPCQGMERYEDENQEADSHLPTVIRLAENKDCRLDLVTSCYRVMEKKYYRYRNVSHCAQLHWYDRQGHTVKVNLKKLIHNECVKLIDRQIHNAYANVDGKGDNNRAGDKVWLREAIASLQKYKNTGKKINYKVIDKRVQYIMDKQKFEEKEKSHKRDMKNHPPQKNILSPSRLKFESYRVFGATLAMLFTGDLADDHGSNDILVVVNWQDINQINKPRIYPKETYAPNDWFPGTDVKFHESVPKIWGIKQCSRRKVSLFDEHGDEILSERAVDLLNEGGFWRYSHVVNKRLLGISEDRKCLIYADEDLQLMQTEPVSDEEEIKGLNVIRNCVLVAVASRLFVYDIHTMRPIMIDIVNCRSLNAVESKTNNFLDIKSDKVKILAVKNDSRSLIGQEDVTRAVIGLIDSFMIVEISDVDGLTHFSMVSHLHLSTPGQPVEAFFISEQDGFLVSCTFHIDISKPWYREHVFHYDYHGNILGILPFLGPGPRSFHSVYMSQKDFAVSRGCCVQENCHVYEEGRRVFLNDGYGGLVCLKNH